MPLAEACLEQDAIEALSGPSVFVFHRSFVSLLVPRMSNRLQVQEVNLQKRRLYWPEADRWVRLRLSTKGIKTIDKYGLDKAARKFGLDLKKFVL